MMGTHDKTQIEQRDAADPERAVVAALERAERAAPGSLTPEAKARIDAWRETELARKATERAAAPLKGVELGGNISEVGIVASSAERPPDVAATAATPEVSGG